MIETLLEMWACDTARHCRFRADAHAMLAAITRFQGGTLRVSAVPLPMSAPDGRGRRIHTKPTAPLAA